MTTYRARKLTIRTQKSLLFCIASFGGLALACSDMVNPVVARTDARQMAPLPRYSVWWEMAKSCSGVNRDVASVTFYSDPNTQARVDESANDIVVGEWNSASNSIVLLDSYVTNPTVVRHEMVHALLRAGGHPAPTFRDDCSGIVSCMGQCARQVGDPAIAPHTARRMPVDSLVVTQTIFPSRIDLSKDSEGWFALVVEVKNTRPYPVWARLLPFPGAPGTAATFGYASPVASQQSYVHGDSVSFAAGETKRVVFDLSAKAFIAANGSNKIRGFFNTRMLPEQALPLTN